MKLTNSDKKSFVLNRWGEKIEIIDGVVETENQEAIEVLKNLGFTEPKKPTTKTK